MKNTNSIIKTIIITAITVLNSAVYSQTLNLTFTISQPTPPQVMLGNDTAICDGATLTLNAGNAGSTYYWNDSYTNQQRVVSTAGTYSVTVTGTSGCTGIGSITIQVNTLPVVNIGADHEFCSGNSVTLNAGSFNGYNWSNGANSQSILVDTTGYYTVTVTDANNCNGISNTVYIDVHYPFANEQICIVTVDTLTWKNKIMWEKTAGVGTLGFNVYKEVASNVYSGIGFVPFTDPGFFIDYTSNPVSHGDKYKITVMDTCGNESGRSPFHKTMNLVISAFGSTMGLSWTEYEDESGNFIPPKYYIYRGSQPDNMNLLDSVTGSFTSYNDPNVFSVYYYIIGVIKDPPCDVFGTGKSLSNIKDNSLLVNVNEVSLISSVNIYPNPANTIANFEFELIKNSNVSIHVMDIAGKEILNYNKENVSTGVQTIPVDVSSIENGMYFYTMNIDGKNLTGKFNIVR